MTQFARIEETAAARIDGYQRAIAFRTVLIHGYANVDDRLVWDLVQTSLRALARQISIRTQAAAPDVVH